MEVLSPLESSYAATPLACVASVSIGYVRRVFRTCDCRFRFLAARRLRQAKKWKGGGRGREEKETLAGKPQDSEESARPRPGVSRYLIGTAWSS